MKPKAHHDRKARPPRGGEDMATAQPAIAKSIFDTFKLPDGRAIGDVRVVECERLGEHYRECAAMLALRASHGKR